LEPTIPESVLVKTTFQETVVDRLTFTVAFVVFRTAGDAALVSVKVSADRNTTVPSCPSDFVTPQSGPSYNVNATLPFSKVPAGPAETVPSSFGSQFCALDVDELMLIVKHSLL